MSQDHTSGNIDANIPPDNPAHRSQSALARPQYPSAQRTQPPLPVRSGSGSGSPHPFSPQPHASSSTTGAISSQAGPSPYDDPTNLLRVYPFLTYQPTARDALLHQLTVAAMHLSPHTRVLQDPSSVGEVYPQHADAFHIMDAPSSAEDWALRNATEAQLRQALSSGQSYMRSLQPSTPDSSSFIHNLPPYPTEIPALPYNFLPSYLPNPVSEYNRQPVRPYQPPTPGSSSSLPSPEMVQEGMDVLKQYMADTLRRTEQAPLTPSTDNADLPDLISGRRRGSSPSVSVSSTPSLARAMARTALTPEASPGPSPTKKQKTQAHPLTSRHLSSLGPSSSLTSMSTTPDKNGKSSVHSEGATTPTGGGAIVTSASSSRRKSEDLSGEDEETDQDDLNWGDDTRDEDGDWEMDARKSPHSSSGVLFTLTPGSARTGERDTRTNFQKLQSLFEDIFEEADSFSAEPSADQIRKSRFFSGPREGTLPNLSPATIEKITRYVARLQKSKKRGVNETFDLDPDVISRVLRLLERSMLDKDDINPFPSDKTMPQGKVKKSKAKKEKSQRSSPESDGQAEGQSVSDVLTQDNLYRASAQLDSLRAAGSAAECVLVILDTERLSKQLLSEELLSLAVGIVKNLISRVILPLVEAMSSERIPGKFLEHIVREEQGRMKGRQSAFSHPTLSSIVTSTVSSLPRVTSLLARQDISFSDQLVIQTVYLAITPLFIVESNANMANKRKVKAHRGQAADIMRGLRVESLSCLRGVFARYEAQRQWIIEEVLGTMGRGSDTSNSTPKFQLVNGASIHTSTALLLQIIQASSFGLTMRIRKLRAASDPFEERSDGATKLVSECDFQEEEARLCAESVESCLVSARMVLTYLVQRSIAGKTTKSSHDTDYKAVLDTFVSDLLVILYLPEWPAAPLYLNVLTRILINALDEPKGGDSALKGIALDYLGDIAAKLRRFHVETSSAPAIASIDQIISTADVEGYSILSERHKAIHSYLASAAREDGMYNSSLDMSLVVWAQELHLAMKKVASVVDRLAEEKTTEARETRTKLKELQEKFKSTLRELWAGDDSLFEVIDHNSANTARAASIAVSIGRPLQNAFGPILHALVSTMGVSLINLRSKALRGLGMIVTVDPDVLGQSAVKQAIDERLSDSSAAVRDAAVELIGKYVVKKPSLAAEYYPDLALRVSDSGLGVRKRVIRLLREIFASTSDRTIKVDICCKLVTLTADSDENIQELATKTVYEMVFPTTAWDKASTAELLVDVVAEFQGSYTVLERGIEQLVQECRKIGQPGRLLETVDALLSNLADATERTDIDPLSHIKAIHFLVMAQADLIDVTKAEVLLSFLRRKPANADEQASNELLLKIFKRCIPSMPRVASSFATRLSEELVPMISAPSGGFPTLNETVACFCAVANHLTRDYAHVTRILLSCESRTRAMRNEWVTSGKATQASSAAGPILIFVCASLAEYCNFDKLGEKDATVKTAVEKISPDQPLYEHLFEAFLDFTKMPIVQTAPSLCLGSLFRAYPILILREEAMEWMDTAFASSDTSLQVRLLGVIYDFLVSEAEKKAGIKSQKKTPGHDLEALIGNAAELSESGLSTAVVQRHINHILAGAKSHHVPTQSAALDILSFTVAQGLYHPLQCLPILISLETSENEAVARRALDLHSTLHAKHSTLVNVRFLEFAKASFEYQRSLTSEVVGHRVGFALLSGWYTLISEKRAWRHDFLKQLCRVFDYDVASLSVPDVGLALYICDNLATLEYKLQEEVMTVVSLLSATVAQATGLVMILESGTVVGEDNEPIKEKRMPTAEAGETVSADVTIHASIIVGLALLTKNYLLDVYGLPEDKCIKYVPGKKTSIGDRPAVRRKEDLIDLSRMPLVRGVTSVGEFKSQCAAFLELIHEDGSFDE